MSAVDPILLRQMAETQARTDLRFANLNSADAMHELLVHQIELEMQNDELRRSQLEIEALRARYYDLYDQAPVGYCSLDDQGRILEANITAASMLGRSRQELSRCGFSDFIAAADQDYYYLHCRLPTIATSQSCELRLLDRAQTECWTHLSTSQGRLPDGTSVTRLVLTDIAALKRSEAAMKTAKANAEAANQAKSQFLANMTHELSTPLSCISIYCALLLHGGSKKKKSDLVALLDQSCDNLATVIHSILAYSKIDAGLVALVPLTFSPVNLIAETQSLLAPAAAQKPLRLVTRLPAKAVSLRLGDPFRLRQILLNLVGNAIKFSSSGEIVLSLEIGPTPLSLRFRVQDAGIGISPDYLQRLGEPFHQGDNSLTRAFGGTGLGLSICTRLLQLMGSSLEIDSSPGVGSDISFVLTLTEAPAAR